MKSRKLKRKRRKSEGGLITFILHPCTLHPSAGTGVGNGGWEQMVGWAGLSGGSGRKTTTHTLSLPLPDHTCPRNLTLMMNR